MNSLQDMNGKELLRFDRPLKCMECPCDGCYPNWTQVRKGWCLQFSPKKAKKNSALASKEWSK